MILLLFGGAISCHYKKNANGHYGRVFSKVNQKVNLGRHQKPDARRQTDFENPVLKLFEHTLHNTWLVC